MEARLYKPLLSRILNMVTVVLKYLHILSIRLSSISLQSYANSLGSTNNFHELLNSGHCKNVVNTGSFKVVIFCNVIIKYRNLFIIVKKIHCRRFGGRSKYNFMTIKHILRRYLKKLNVLSLIHYTTLVKKICIEMNKH